MDRIEVSAQPMAADNGADNESDDCNMDPDHCAKLKKLRNYLTLERMVLLKTLIGQVIHIIDLALDISITVKFYTNGEILFAVWSCCFISIPYLFNMLFSLLGFVIIAGQNPGTKKPWCALIALHALPIVPALWYAPPAHLGPIFSRLQTRRTTERKGRLVNFTLSSLVYYLSNLFMLSGRLLAVSAFAASVGLIPMLYVLLTLACVAVLTDVAVSWGHTERSKLSKENIVPRLVEVFGLLSDVPFSITFMMGPARIGCYCLWAFETLFLDVFAFAWLSSQQISAAANTNSTILETSA
ncbi:unnamed protein product, partial [Schistocephalus solidus]|uniref:XK-related protein n=1 Tax=Schistocephalus solidus TaxID=70667 RepID=A0A183S861_SCHSO